MPPVVPLHPAAELQARIVDILRADSTLGGLLFPTWSVSTGANDFRVYGASVELPEGSAIREALPRILIDTVQFPFGIEQLADQPLQGEVAVYMHTLVPKEESEHAEAIDARASALLISTQMSSVRIIAADLSYEGQRRKGRSGPFNDAWEIVTQFRSPHVGVIV